MELRGRGSQCTRNGSIGAGHLGNKEAQVALFWGLLDFFCRYLAWFGRVETSVLLTDDISCLLCHRGMHAHISGLSLREGSLQPLFKELGPSGQAFGEPQGISWAFGDGPLLVFCQEIYKERRRRIGKRKAEGRSKRRRS